MNVNVNAMVEAMSTELAPIVGDLATKGASALIDEARKSSDAPLTLVVLDIADDWVTEHGHELTADLIGQLADALTGDGGIDVLADHLTARQLTELTDAYQTAEAETRLRTSRGLKKIGRIIGNIAQHIGQAALAAMGV